MSTEVREQRKRRYEKRIRAEREDETRRRITQAAVELHSTVGPSRTTISAIAELAGVRRATVYRHFPDERSLLRACSGHVAVTNPLPDPSPWWRIADPERRLRAALDALYAYYERNEQLLVNIARDRETMPILREVGTRRVEYIRTVEDGLVRGWGARGGRVKSVRAALALALDFGTWRLLVRTRGLNRGQAVDLMASAVRPWLRRRTPRNARSGVAGSG